MNRVDEANRLVDEGCHPIPLVGKQPAIKNYWLYEPTRTNNRFWFTRHNLGLLLAGLVVIDVDSPAGEIWYRSHVGSLDPPHQTIVQATRGRHYYWKPPPGVEMSKIQLPGVDILTGPRVTVTLPPSIHASGKPYEYLSRCPFAELPEINPELLCDFRQSTKISECCETKTPGIPGRSTLVGKTIRNIRSYLRAIPSVQGQSGNKGLMRCCFVLESQGFDFQTAFALLSDWNQSAEPPWSERELLRGLQSVFNRKRGTT